MTAFGERGQTVELKVIGRLEPGSVLICRQSAQPTMDEALTIIRGIRKIEPRAFVLFISDEAEVAIGDLDHVQRAIDKMRAEIADPR